MGMSTMLICALLGFYLLIAISCLVEKQYIFALYWIGAIILNIAVLFMSK